MRSNYEALGKHIRLVDVRNSDMSTDRLLGINIDKYFMPSVANVIGTDLSRYKLITKGRFACNPMHVGRDERLPVALYTEDDPAIVSPAYFMFEIIDESVLLPEYLMMWFKRAEFDRICWLKTDGSVRGGISWDDIELLGLPVPTLNKQKEIVKAYQTITNRIALKRKINECLEATARSYFKSLFAPYASKTKVELPNGWMWANVGDYCNENIAHISSSDIQNGIFYLNTSSVTQNYFDPLQTIQGDSEVPSRAKRKVYHGDIVFSTVRPNLKHYGIVYYPVANMVVSTGFTVLHNNNQGVSNELLYLWITNDSISEYLQSIVENSVSTYPTLNVNDLLAVKIVVPDKEILEKANHFLGVIFFSIRENNREIQQMTTLQDVLLPKFCQAVNITSFE